MMPVARPARFTALNDMYKTMEVNANKLEDVDWSSLFEQMEYVHSVEFYNSGDTLLEVDQKLFLCLRNNLQMNDTLTVLILNKIGLTVNQTELLCQALCRARWLQHLSLQECGLTDHCCKMICNSLLTVPSVCNLDLSGNNITEAGATSIADLLKHEELARGICCWMGSLRGRIVDKEKVLGLSRLTLNDNPISDEGLNYIVERLYDDIWIKAIDMQRCGITNVGAKLVIRLLHVNKDISVFDLRDNSRISASLLAAILKKIKKNQRTLHNEIEEQWISTKRDNIEYIPESQKELKGDNETGNISRTNVKCHLRRTQSCRDQRIQRYAGAHVWTRTSVDQLNESKKVSKLIAIN